MAQALSQDVAGLPDNLVDYTGACHPRCALSGVALFRGWQTPEELAFTIVTLDKRFQFPGVLLNVRRFGSVVVKVVSGFEVQGDNFVVEEDEGDSLKEIV